MLHLSALRHISCCRVFHCHYKQVAVHCHGLAGLQTSFRPSYLNIGSIHNNTKEATVFVLLKQVIPDEPR